MCCACLYMCVQMYVGACAHVHTCLWRSEVNSDVIPQIPATLDFSFSFFFCKIKSLL